MKIEEACRAAFRVRPNDLELEDQLRWLSELDGKIMTEVMLLDASETFAVRYTEEDMQKELLVGFPYDKIYVPYLMAMIDFANGEYDRYQNDKAIFDGFYGEYVRWFARVYKPADTKKGGRYYDD